MSSQPSPIDMTVPSDAVIRVVEVQRNNAMTELAKMTVFAEQLLAERDEARAELAALKE